MEGSGPIRPVAGTSVAPAPRDQNEATNGLPRGKSVAAAEESGDTRLSDKAPSDQQRFADSEAESETRTTEIDPETREVLLKIVDTSSGLVRWQVPAEQVMNMRAYAEREAQADAEAAADVLPGTKLARDV